MNSHIQIPKCVFKEFVRENYSFYKYDIRDGILSRGYPKSTFTEEGYYSELMEAELNKYVETPLKKLLDFAREVHCRELPIIIEPIIIEIAFVYAKSLIARSPILYQSVLDNSLLLGLLDVQSQHDIVVDYAMKDKNSNILKNLIFHLC